MGLELRVIEREAGVAGAYCGRLFGMLGADVIKLEPPAGDRMRRGGSLLRTADDGEVSARFEYLNAFKRSVVVDPEDTEASDTLIAGADVLVDHIDGDPGAALVDHDRLAALNPGLVHVAISSFGLSGPYREYRGNDFVDFAAGGYGFLTGEPDREPVQAGVPLAGYITGLNAAIGAMAAVRERRANGRGQIVDVAAMESMAAAHQWTITIYTHQGVIKRRAGNLHAESFIPMGPVPCADGWVGLGIATPAQWEGFCIAIDMPELLADERFQTGGQRFDHARELFALLEPALMAITAAELVERCEEHHVPASPVLEVIRVLEEEQLGARDFWTRDERVGGVARMPERAFHIPWMEAPFRAAPTLGADTDEVLGNPPATVTGGEGA